MESLYQGILFGLALAILAGPILVALLQAGVEQGFKAGMTVGFGVWVSDLLFILSVYFGVSYVLAATEWEGFELTLGMIGGVILIIFGLGTLLSAPPDLNAKGDAIGDSFSKLFMKGFLINTLNPFTVFFWLSVMSAVVVDSGLSVTSTVFFYTGLFSTIVCTDTLKVYLARSIRTKLKPVHLLWLRRISGAALVIFGVVLIIRVLPI